MDTLREWSVMIHYRTPAGRPQVYIAQVLPRDAVDEAAALRVAEAQLNRHPWRRVGEIRATRCVARYR